MCLWVNVWQTDSVVSGARKPPWACGCRRTRWRRCFLRQWMLISVWYVYYWGIQAACWRWYIVVNFHRRLLQGQRSSDKLRIHILMGTGLRCHPRGYLCDDGSVLVSFSAAVYRAEYWSAISATRMVRYNDDGELHNITVLLDLLTRLRGWIPVQLDPDSACFGGSGLVLTWWMRDRI